MQQTVEHTLFGSCKKVLPSYRMYFSPVRTASGVTDEEADLQQYPRSSKSPQGFPGPALPGLWKRAAPQSQATLQQQMIDLGRSTHSSWPEHQLPPRDTSLREQYTLPGQVQRAGRRQHSNLSYASTCRPFVEHLLASSLKHD